MLDSSNNIYRKFGSMDRLNRLILSGEGALLIMATLAILLIIAVSLSSLFELGPIQKYIFLAGAILLMGAILIKIIIHPLLVKSSFSALARRVEIFHPELKDTLSAAIELKRNLESNPEGYSVEFIRAVIENASNKCAKVDFNVCVNKNPIIRGVRWASIPVAITLIFSAIFPSGFTYAIMDFSHPSIKLEKPDPFSLSAIPGDIEMMKGADLRIGAVIGQTLFGQNGLGKPKDVEIIWSYAGGSQEFSMAMQPLNPGKMRDSTLAEASFDIKIEKVTQPFKYRLTAMDVSSPEYQVDVVDYPRIIDLEQKLDFPGYTGLPSTTVNENDGNVSALPGTLVTIVLKASKPIAGGKAIFEKSGEIPLKVNGQMAEFGFMVRMDDAYHLEIADMDGLENPDPIVYNIFAASDFYPEIEILQPGRDLMIGGGDALPLVIRARDDYGFSGLKLLYQVTTSGMEQQPAAIEIPLRDIAGDDITIGYNWDLETLGLIPGDAVNYYAIVGDNDSYSGPKTAESKHYSLRFPSVDQVLADFDSRREENTGDLEEAIADQERLNQEISELRREMMRLQNTDWDKNRRLEEAVNRQKQISNALEELQENMDKNLESVRQNQLNTLEIMEKAQKIADLLKEIDSPELMEALEKLQEAMKNIDQNQMQKALENLQFSQEEYLQKLEKALEMLKRLRAEQKFDQLKQLADKMKAEQEKIEESIQPANESELKRLAERQEEVSKELDAFNEALDKMKQFNEETPVMPKEDLESLKKQADSSGLKEDMQQASKNMKSGNKGESSGKCKSSSQKLSEMASNMESMQMQMRSGQNSEVGRLARKAFNDVIYLSQSQEELMDQLASMTLRDSLIRTIAPPQQKLGQNTSRVRADLDSIYRIEPRVDPSMSTDLAIAVGRMQEATENLELKNKNASVPQTHALKELNRVGFKLLQLLKQNASSSCGGSACPMPGNSSSPQLSQLAEQQQNLNSQASAMAQQLRHGASQQETLARMAAEQEAIRQGLRELLQAGEEGGAGKLGRLDDLGDEMKEVVDEFERGQVNRNTLMRQENILTRLLDAQKSLRTQGFKEERKAEMGENIFRAGPQELSSTESDIHGRLERLQEALKENYPQEYRNMIRAYIDALTERLSNQNHKID